MLKVKLITEPPGPRDGIRVLVEREVPSGIDGPEMLSDVWLKGAAPSEELRRWREKHPGSWKRYAQRYQDELRRKPSVVRKLRGLARECETVTLVHADTDSNHSHVRVLYDIVRPQRDS